MLSDKLMKAFGYGAFVPVLFNFTIAVVFLSVPFVSDRAVLVSAGVLLLLGGVCCIAAFFVEKLGAAGLLAGIAQCVVALWLFVSATTSLYIISVAFCAVLLLREAETVYRMVKLRGSLFGRVCFIVAAALIVALCIVVIVDPFNAVRDLTNTLSAALLADSVASAGMLAFALFTERKQKN